MKNRDIAELFERIADALEIEGETGFKVVAYRKGARVLRDLTEDVAKVAAEGRLRSVPGIGEGLAKKVDEYLRTGRMAKHDEVMAKVPEGLLALLEVQGLGGKTVHLLRDKLGIAGLDGLERAIADGSLAKLPGMGEKKVENIRKGLEAREKAAARLSVRDAAALADEIVAYLAAGPGVGRVSAAGSLRRMRETVGDIDILAEGRDGAAVVRRFVRHPGAVRVLAEGDTKGSIVLRSGDIERQVDLRVVGAAEYGAALLYFTGSKAHNIKLRGLAKERSLKISEYGVFKGAKRLAGRSEEDCYAALGLPWVPPEMREDRGEVELALADRLPRLVEAGDIRGDLHVHTRASDGDLSLREVAALARERGYAYIAVCDHSQAAKYAHGLAAGRLAEEMAEIEALNRTFTGFRVLKGSEVDILTDGSLDFPDELLARLDFVVAAVHSGFKKDVTGRMLKALANPHVRTIAHPTGRLISGREGYDVDIDKVIDEAARRGKALELNAHYDRLDLDEFNLRKARERGVGITIGTDTHGAGGLAMMRFGLGIARRAWLGRNDVLNTRTAAELLAGPPAAGKSPARRKRRSRED
ncbi:MAG: DNA polymerase/3'-5' exonuclease PolX [Candidatus Aminicenantes bacterium]|nr:DNA polymerase/3'-5' exonuclease PolX [Candidatus Aminicenantes bacterium]